MFERFFFQNVKAFKVNQAALMTVFLFLIDFFHLGLQAMFLTFDVHVREFNS